MLRWTATARWSIRCRGEPSGAHSRYSAGTHTCGRNWSPSYAKRGKTRQIGVVLRHPAVPGVGLGEQPLHRPRNLYPHQARQGVPLLGGRVARRCRPGLRLDPAGGAVGAVPAKRWPDIPVVAEGDTLPDGITWDERAQERPEVLRWLSRPGDLGDPKAYGIQIRGDSMLPAYRPNMIAIVSPELEVRDGDEVYVQLASGECLVRLLHTSRGVYLLQPYNLPHNGRVVGQEEVEAMHAIVYSRHG